MNTRAGGNKVNSKTQIEGSKHSNVIDSNHSTRDKETGVLHYASSRNYKQGIQKDLEPAQTTLNSFWKGKEKDMWTWSEEMDELEEIEREKAQGRQESNLSYV